MKTIGILGGMGPAATNDLCAWITRLTPARRDQEHVPVLCYNNPAVPDRTAAILGTGPSPVPELRRMVEVLAQAGAAFLLLPCNTAHAFLPELRQSSPVPILDMIGETASAGFQRYPQARRVGLLATKGTVSFGLYQRAFGQHGIQVITPEAAEQELVTQAIAAVKGNELEVANQLLQPAIEALLGQDIAYLVAGCTEIPLAVEAASLRVPLLNPAEILAQVAIRRAQET